MQCRISTLGNHVDTSQVAPFSCTAMTGLQVRMHTIHTLADTGCVHVKLFTRFLKLWRILRNVPLRIAELVQVRVRVPG